MEKGKKWLSLLITGSVVVVLGLGFLAYTPARAAVSGPLALFQDEDTENGEEATPEEPLEPAPIPGRDGFRLFGHHGWFQGALDYDSFLAKTLGITMDELQTAQQTAISAALDEAVARGYITEERAELMKARIALMKYIDKDALIAGALGISVDELQSAREDGQSIRDLIDELDLDISDLKDSLKADYEEAVQAAVDDGIITQDQADEFLSGETRVFDLGGRLGRRGGPRGFDCCCCCKGDSPDENNGE